MILFFFWWTSHYYTVKELTAHHAWFVEEPTLVYGMDNLIYDLALAIWNSPQQFLLSTQMMYQKEQHFFKNI